MKKNIFLIFAVLLFSFALSASVNAFDFTGYTRYINGTAINNTNVTVEVYEMVQDQGPTLNATYSNASNSSGFFNVSGMTGNDNFFYKPILRKFNATTPGNVDYIGQSLPEFPYPDILRLAQSPVNFYLKQGATINITAVNATGSAVSFNYMIKDQKLGYPIDSEWINYTNQTTIYLPADRNYSIMIYPNQSFPVSYDLNDSWISSNGYKLDIVFNASTLIRRVSGYALKSNAAGFDDLKIISYLVEPGDMVFQDHPMPYNMSAWNCPTGPESCESDIYNTATGFYNITLPGAAMGARILLFATAKNGSDYYGAFRNITLNYSEAEESGFNFSLQTLLGSVTNISLDNAGGGQGGPQQVNITTKKFPFLLKNETESLISGFAHVEIEVDYSSLNGSAFSWMLDVDSQDEGSFDLPIINYSIKKIQIFSQEFAPLKTSKEVGEIQDPPVYFILTQFEPGSHGPGGEAFADISMDMLISNSTCDVPNPPSSCSLFSQIEGGGEKNMSDFDPFKIVIGGGKISIRIRKESNNITVHYVNVDMLASGPPDADFDSAATENESGASLESAWRFGSMGPEIYDKVLVGIPYNDTDIDESAPVSVLIEHLYDEDWNSIWNSTNDPYAQNYSNSSIAYGSYSDFNERWFNASKGGMNCSNNCGSLSDNTCCVDNSSNMIWLNIPHFSGLGPVVSSITKSNVTASTVSGNVNCTNNCNVTINVSNGNYTLSQSLQNITINNTDSNGYVRYFRIYNLTNSAWNFMGTNSSNHTNYNFTLYNGSDSTLHRYLIEINKSNVKTTRWNFTYNVNGSSELLVLEINLNCVENWTCTAWSSWSTCSGAIQTRTRTCTENTNCSTTADKPSESESQSCTTPGGGGGGSATYSIDTLSEGKIISKTLRVDDQVKFKIKNVEHTVKVLSISANSVEIEISSTPIKANLTLNEKKKFDIDADNVYELAITLTKISGSWISLTFEGISETVPAEEIVPPAEEAPTEEEAAVEEEITPTVAKKALQTWWFWVIIAIIVVALVWLLLPKKRKKF